MLKINQKKCFKMAELNFVGNETDLFKRNCTQGFNNIFKNLFHLRQIMSGGTDVFV